MRFFLFLNSEFLFFAPLYPLTPPGHRLRSEVTEETEAFCGKLHITLFRFSQLFFSAESFSLFSYFSGGYPMVKKGGRQHGQPSHKLLSSR